jgi:nitrate/TMAO reductase-like tetraheme cytochrome c subunit
MNWFLRLIAKLWTNWITLLGTAIATTAALGTLLLLFSDVGGSANPYVTAILLVSLPGLFVLGLFLIPIGLLWQRRRGAAPGEVETAIYGVLQNKTVARSVGFVILVSFVNIAIVAGAGERLTKHASSTPFCGTTCHTPMEPEWVAYQRSPHAQVACVDCHVGHGVVANIKAKINGVNQLVGVVTNEYSRPVPSPIQHMRKAVETCGGCHSAEKYWGAKDKLYPNFKDDQANTPSFDAMRLFVGGRNPITRKMEGIHSHADPNKSISYEMVGEGRTRMGKLTVTENGKVVAEYARKEEKGTVAGTRTMDCLDCHNHPAHQLDLGVARAVNDAMYVGALERSVPFAVAVSRAVLTAANPPREGAAEYFKKAVAEAYKKDHADETPAPEAMAKIADTLTELYLRNIFPDMKVTWGTYPSEGDHRDAKDQHGCFRCHDSDYEAVKLADGRKAKLDRACDTCHAALATEANPEEFDDTLTLMFPLKE